MPIQTRYLYLLKYILPITDVLMLNIVYISAYYFTAYLGKGLNEELQRHYLVVCNLLWLFNTAVFGLYSEYNARKIERIYRGTVKSLLLHFVLFSIYLLFAKDYEFSRSFLLFFYIFLFLAFMANRFIGTYIQHVLINKFNSTRKVAVLGNNDTGIRLVNYLQKQRNVDFYGIVGDDECIYGDGNGTISLSACEKLQEAAAYGVKDVYVSVAPSRMHEIGPLILEADKQLLRLKFIPDLAGALAAPYTISYMGGEFPIITLRNEPLESMPNRFKKRAFDVIFSSLVIVFVLSWLYPIIALLIKMQSKGPVLFKQERSGINDQPFWCYKFRSMRMNNDSDKKQATKGDSRITSVGRFLRKSSLDEMPQFFNVFLGNMSVVGPRPHMLRHTEEYKKIISQYMVRQFMKPGITGWAQVHGFRGETKDDSAMEKRVEHDIWYLEHWSSMLDVRIIFMTIINVFHGEENAY
ncbi:undecaprenyl-phosphate glucose phosphotransferase [Pedobacter sp. L105]|uniref:undecaprenyl-phosphate glucose phosphotransferase n=1 Tax=Pedobacter sp. L105 TaxID=1641871 RepID=UPI0020B13083|nr:undecaprenyl-phosphate glucose phosphotransferase [Pedobacter sp. L105]